MVDIYEVYLEEITPHVAIVGYKRSERVYMNPPMNSNDFTYVYKYMFNDFYIQFPLSDFECQMLTTMNVAPNQLHTNNKPFLSLFKFSVIFFVYRANCK